MVLKFRPIPTLRGKDAEVFNKKADEALKNRKNAIVFDEHIIEMKKILKKARMCNNICNKDEM